MPVTPDLLTEITTPTQRKNVSLSKRNVFTSPSPNVLLDNKEIAKEDHEHLEAPKNNSREKQELVENIHSLKNFPPEAQRIIKRDAVVSQKLAETLLRTNTELTAYIENIKPLLNFTETLNTEEKSALALQPEDQNLLSQIDNLNRILNSSSNLSPDKKLLSLVQIAGGTALVDPTSSTYQEAAKIAAQVNKSKISAALQKIKTQIRGSKENEFSSEEIASKGSDFQLTLKNIIPTCEYNAKNNAAESYKQAELLVQNAIKQTLGGSENIEKITEYLIKAKNSLDNARYQQKFAASIEEIIKNRGQEVNTPIPDVQQLVKNALAAEIKVILSSYGQKALDNIATAADTLSEGKGFLAGRHLFKGTTVDLNIKAVWTPQELNDTYNSVNAQINTFDHKSSEFQALVPIPDYSLRAIIESKYPTKVLSGKDAVSRTRFLNSIEQFLPVTKEEYQGLEQKSLNLVNTDRILYHGTSNPFIRNLILQTGELRSRVVQEKLTGGSYSFIQAGERAHGLGSGMTKNPNQEKEQLCFSVDAPVANYSRADQEGSFYTAVPGPTIFRDYAFFDIDGIHIFPKNNPEEGFLYNLADSPGKIVMDHEAEKIISIRYGQELIDDAKRRLQDKLIISEDISKGLDQQTFQDTNLPKVKTARIVPVGTLMDGPTAGNSRNTMTYQINYTT